MQVKQTQDCQETICKIHNLEFIAVDLDMSDKSQIQFFCGKCLVDKLNNNKVTTIEQSKERIQKIKTQQQEIKTKENQSRLNYYKNILDQIMDFKRSIDDSLEKMYKQIQQYIFPIQKEKSELHEQYLQLNYFEDIKQLSELYSQDNKLQSTKLIEDNNFIDEITRQFELLFNNAEYFQTLDIFKKTKQTIEDLMENNILQLPPLLVTKNESKTPSLNRICPNHKKEIIMIDMDSQNKKIEDRFACVDCIAENPQIKYSTIESINKQWRDYNSESDKIISEYQQESKNKKSDLFKLIASMRKNYNKKLNEISEKVISEQFQSFDKSKQTKQINNVTIQVLEDEQLLKDLKQLIDKQKITQNQQLINLKNQDSIFKKEIENHLESLKQYYQQDVQQSLDILKEISIEKNLILQLSEFIQQFSKCTLQKDDNYQDLIQIINNVEELINQAKDYQCQSNLFEQTVTLYQQHTNKIDQIQQKIQNSTKDQVIKPESINASFQNLSNVLNDYTITIDNKSKQIKKFCNIQQLEIDLIKVAERNKNLEVENANLLNQIQMSLDQKQQEDQEALIKLKDESQQQINSINAKLQLQEKENIKFKELFEQQTEEMINLKKQNEEDKLNTIKNLENKKNTEILEINKRLNQKESEIQIIQRQLDYFNQVYSIQYPKSLLFSNTNKHGSCQVSEGGKVVECNGGYYSCLCDQAIQRLEKYNLHSKCLKFLLMLLQELDLEILSKKIIILVMEMVDSIQQVVINILILIIKTKQIRDHYQNSPLLLMILQQQKQVLNQNTLNGQNRIMHKKLLQPSNLYLVVGIRHIHIIRIISLCMSSQFQGKNIGKYSHLTSKI